MIGQSVIPVKVHPINAIKGSLQLWLVKIGELLSEMGVFSTMNSIADIEKVYSRYQKCNCGYLKLPNTHDW